MHRRGLQIVAWCAALLGCGRVGFDPIVPERPRPVCDWRAQPPRFGEVELLADPISLAGSNELDPFVDAEGSLWFASDRGPTATDIWVARSVSGGLEEPVLATDVDGGEASDDTGPHILGDVMVHAATGPRGIALYLAQRPSQGEPFGAGVLQEPGIGALRDHRDPHLGTDPIAGTTILAWAPTRISTGGQSIHFASRAIDARFDAEFLNVTEPGLGGNGTDSDPTLDVSLTILVFASRRSGTRSLWYATRPDPDSAFDAPIELPALVDGGEHGEPFLTPDGCTLYFASFATGDADLHRVPILR